MLPAPADRLYAVFRHAFPHGPLVVVSNRQPYAHTRGEDGAVAVDRPAGGLALALDPVLQALGGTWVAWGHGDADRNVVDAHDRVRVPPENPSYQIRRVWLTEEEEKGYYYGFSNEGLWPLCHVAHTRPIFRSQDWEKYVEVNRKFANALIEEAKTDHPVILVQDYHFALLPRMVKQKLPKAIDMVRIRPWDSKRLAKPTKLAGKYSPEWGRGNDLIYQPQRLRMMHALEL